MKKIISLLIAALLLISAPLAFAENDRFAETCEAATQFNYHAFVIYLGDSWNYTDADVDFRNEYDEGCDGYIAYTTNDEFLNAVFIPDGNGNIAEIHIVGRMDKVFGIEDGVAPAIGLNRAYSAMNGFLSPYIVEMSDVDSDKLIGDFVSASVDAYAAPNTMDADPIYCGDFAVITVYRKDDKYGVLIEFTTPLTKEFLDERCRIIAADD